MLQERKAGSMTEDTYQHKLIKGSLPPSKSLDQKEQMPLSSQFHILTRAGNFSKVPVTSWKFLPCIFGQKVTSQFAHRILENHISPGI